MDSPLAYFLTWTSYGSWLHGDERGSVDRTHNALGTEPLSPSAVTRARAVSRLASAPVVLDEGSREVVDSAVHETCVAKGWTGLAVNARSNHVHVVVVADAPPERVMVALKAWATRRLRESGRIASGSRVWTRHGSTRYLWTDQDLDDVCGYVLDGQ
jgi:REP element-mobilizing transposase RayT